MRLRGIAKRLVYGPLGRFRYYGSWIHCSRDSSAFYVVCRDEVYEREIVQCIQAFARPNTFVFDVGANIGLMGAVAIHAQPTSTVVSFEPSPSSVPYLRKTVAGRSNWRLVEKALADKPGTLDFTVSNDSLFEGFKPNPRTGDQRTVQVPVSTLDAEWDALGCPEVSLVKIDVEGAEPMVFAGGDKLFRTRPVVITEWYTPYFSKYGTDPADLLQFAERYGYLIYSIPLQIPVRRIEDLSAQSVQASNFLLLPRTA